MNDVLSAVNDVLPAVDDVLPAVNCVTPSHDMVIEGQSSAPPSPELNGITRDVLALPIYLHLPGDGLRQTHLLVSVTIRANEEGTLVKAFVTCDELSPPFARPGRSASAFVMPGVAVYVPGDILGSPVYIVVEKLRGIRLKVRTRLGAYRAKLTAITEAIGHPADLHRMATWRPLHVRGHRGPQACR